jgi:hypothetical protein
MRGWARTPLQHFFETEDPASPDWKFVFQEGPAAGHALQQSRLFASRLERQLPKRDRLGA